MRDKLIELIGAGRGCPYNANKYSDGGKFCKSCEHSTDSPCWAGVIADHLIANGVTFSDVPDNNVGKWIPVSERLPDCEWGAECPEPVLYKMKGTGTVYAGYYGTGGVWRDRYFREYVRSSVDVDDVACWMYQYSLPESPKEGEA